MIDITTYHLPQSPGVYFFKDSKGDIIYIGKAKNLKKRVKSYFRKSATHSIKTICLVKNIASLELIVVKNELEALILENKLIKKHKPRYNISLKDDKTYAYLKLSKETFPRLSTTRKLTKTGTFFGPYIDGRQRKLLTELILKLFKIRICKTLPKKPCLNYHINLCTAPCIQNVTPEAYAKQVSEAKKFLQGKNIKQIQKQLESELHKAAQEEEYEVALEKQKQLEALDVLTQRQNIEKQKHGDQDVLVFASNKQEQAIIIILTIRKGTITGKKTFKFEYQEDLVRKFITQYYSGHYIPDELILEQPCWYDKKDKELLLHYLSLFKKGKIIFTLPQKGDKKKLIELAKVNIQEEISTNSLLHKIQNALNLPKLPITIECFDISNLSYTHIVGGMTRWYNTQRQPEESRRFLIKSVSDKNDDYQSMYEVVLRRYRNLKEFPDLIIIDGGKGQLQAALKALDELQLTIPIIALAKQHEEIYMPEQQKPIQLNPKSAEMLLLRNIRDSVHTYVLAYNRKRRDMSFKDQTSSFKRSKS